MTLQQLEYIIALDTYRHFVTAAEKCFITQPTLTMQVKKLEQDMGFQLFDRSKQPLEPTSEGAKIIVKAREILREVNGLREMITSDKESISGTFRIGIIPTLAPYLLPRFIGSFTQKHPDTRLTIEENKSGTIIEKLKQGTLDIGLLSTPLNESAIREIPLYKEPFHIFAHQDHPILKQKSISQNKLPKTGLWLLNEGHCFRNQSLKVCDRYHQKDQQLVYESGSIESLKNIVLSQGGFTLLPALAIDKEKEADFTQSFSGNIPSREISLVVHQSFVKETLINELHASIIKHIPEDFQKNKKFIRVTWR